MVIKYVAGIINWDHRNYFNAIMLRWETWNFSTMFLDMKSVKLTNYSALHTLQTSKISLLKDMSIKSKSWWNFIVNQQRREEKWVSNRIFRKLEFLFSSFLSFLHFIQYFQMILYGLIYVNIIFFFSLKCLRHWWDSLRCEHNQKI